MKDDLLSEYFFIDTNRQDEYMSNGLISKKTYALR
jgi:hypothetical protein